MQNQNRVLQAGVLAASPGAQIDQAADRQGAGLVTELNGRYATLAAMGQLFHAGSGSVTIAAANVGPLAAATGQPILGLYNPLTSGRNLHILKHGVTTVSGTPGGPMVWNYGLQQNITQAPSNVIVPGLLAGGAGGGAVAKAFANVALTGSTLQTYLRDAVAISAVAAAFIERFLMEDDGGDIIVPPGGMLSLAAFAAGTTHLVRANLTWAELPV